MKFSSVSYLCVISTLVALFGSNISRTSAASTWDQKVREAGHGLNTVSDTNVGDGLNQERWIVQEDGSLNEISDQPFYLERLANIMNTKRRMSGWVPPFASQINGFDNYKKKRQIRYHQCYFNPISCFKRRK